MNLDDLINSLPEITGSKSETEKKHLESRRLQWAKMARIDAKKAKGRQDFQSGVNSIFNILRDTSAESWKARLHKLGLKNQSSRGFSYLGIFKELLEK